MSNNQIMVNMKFQADTTQAKQKMQELQAQLSQVMKVNTADLPGSKIANNLNQASIAAAQLKVHLQSAFNQDTGKLDLSKFNQEMKKSGMTLQQYKMALAQAGPAGQQAFNQLAISVAQAEVPIIRISQRMQKLGQTFANTIRWQISSTALMAVMSTISQAYDFAKDLNKSLNDIRIVTSYSADEMERFAIQANKAAKALSTTTTEYTKASLIYFQQGLTDEEVQKRTDLTIKMANVTGQSVGEVSDQLTSVWNNFDNGTKSLEHYVDVMVALGAATASSSKEISEGLNKFAAVAETVGLSYEYAAAALATVTATTRQSADIVGTAFKTLFARIQDLELGKTLDDGTTLGQYSQALAAVGINIKDVNGEVKDMNSILDEMGAKWNTLNKDQQIALAQNVAGVRQYTQLIALMDNWSFFQENLSTSLNSTGALQEQADIYAESWKAASAEVTAALESIYNSILDDDVFIDILHFFADLFENINDVIKAVGGLQGVINLLATAFLTLGQKSVISGVQSLGASFMIMTSAGRTKLEEERTKALESVTSNIDTSTPAGEARKQYIQDSIQLEQDYQKAVENATAAQKEMGRILKDNVVEQGKKVEQMIQEAEIAEQQASTAAFAVKKNYLPTVNNNAKEAYNKMMIGAQQQGAANSFIQNTGLSYNPAIEANIAKVFNEGQVSDQALGNAGASIEQLISRINQVDTETQEGKQKLMDMFGPQVAESVIKYRQELEQALLNIKELQGISEDKRSINVPQGLNPEDKKALSTARGQITRAKNTLQKENITEKEKISAQENLNKYSKQASDIEKKSNSTITNSANQVTEAYEKQEKVLQKNIETVKDGTKTMSGSAEAIDNASNAARQNGAASQTAAQGVHQYNNRVKETPGMINSAITTTVTFSEKLVAFSSMAMSAAMAINAFKSLGSIWSNEDASLGDKIVQTMMSFGMVIPMVTSAFKAQNVQKLLSITITKAENGVTVKSTGGKIANAIATWAQKHATDALNASLLVSLGYFALVAIAIMAIIAIIYPLVKAFEKEKTAVEKASEAHKQNKQDLEALNEELEKTKTNLEEVKTLLDSYKEVSNAFDSLVEGSSAWNENLYKHNEIINELLKKYPELIEMGVIGYDTNGFYTVLNEGLLQQYTQGMASVEMLEAQIAQTVGTINVNKSALELSFAKRNAKLDSEQLNRLSSAHVTDLVSMNAEGQTIVNGKTYGESMDYWQYNLMSSLYSAIEAGDDWEQITANMTQTYGEKGADFVAAAKNFVADYKKLSEAEIKEREASIERLKQQTKALYISLAQSMLSYQQGFSDLTAQQTQAAATILADKIEGFFNTVPTYQIAQGQAVSNEFANELAKFVGYEGATGWDATKDMSYNLEKSSLGQKVVDKYFQETYGQPLESFGTDIEWTARTIEFKLEDGSEEIVSLTSIVSNTLTDAAYELSNMADIIQTVATHSKETLAAITLSFNDMAEADMQKIGTQINPGDKTSGYKLNDKYITEAIRLKYGNEGLTYSAGSGVLLNGTSIIDNKEEIETYIADLTLAAQNYNAALIESIKLNEDRQKGNTYITEQAELYDLEAEALQRYSKSLQEANKISYEAAAKIAVANAKMSKGLDQLEDALKDSLYVLKNHSTQSYEFAEAATEVGEALKLMFGVDISNNLISEWAKSGDLEKLTAGGEEAVKTFQKLELAAGKDYVASLNLDEHYKTQFTSMLEELTAQEYDGITIGIKGEIDQSYIDSINKLLETGAITADEVNAMFNSIGWDPNITWNESEEVVSDTTNKIIRGNELSDVSGNPETLSGSWERIVTTGIVKTPVIGDVTSAPKSTSSIKTNTTSGGSSKKIQKKTKSDEVERYHEINEELQDLQRTYDNLAKAKDRAFGQSKLKLMEQERQATEDLIKAQERYIDEIKTNLVSDRDKLSEYGASFKDGRISNYDEMYQKNIDQYNWAVEQKNAGNMTDEQFEEYEKEYEEFTKDIAQYEETINLLEGELDNLVELQNQAFDQKLEAIEYSVELKIDLAEESIKPLEYQIDNLGDSWDDLQKKVGLYGKTLGQEVNKMQAYRKGLQEALKLSVSDADVLLTDPNKLQELLNQEGFTEEQIEQLRSYRDGLMESMNTMKEMRETVQEDLVNAFEDWNSEMSEGVEKLDRLSNMLQGYRDIIDLVGKDNLGISNDLLRKMNQTNVDNANQSLKATKDILEANKRALKEAKANLEAAVTEEDRKFWQDTIDTITEQVESGEEELLSRWQTALQAAADAYADAVEQVMETFEKSMAGIAGSFDALQTKYDQQKTINERYLADYEKIYNLSKLTRDISKSIDETDSVKAKRELRDLEEEIYSLQQSGAKVTQYEVDELRARYDLRLAEIALEEAQNAKSQVRMQRDSEGNWSYVYTADQDNIAAAEQNVEDKLYAYQELAQNRIDEMSEQMIQLPQDFADAMRAIATDMALTEEERQAKLEETTEFYRSQYEYLGQQLGVATDNAKWLYENDWNNYAIATGYKISNNAKWVDNFNETIIAQTTGYNNLEDIQTAFKDNTAKLLIELAGTYNTYQVNVDAAMDNAGTSVTDFANIVDKETEEVKEKTKEAGQEISDLAKDGEEGFKGIVDAAEKWLDDYNTEVSKYIDENNVWIESIGSIISKYAEIAPALKPVQDELIKVTKEAQAAAAAVKQVNKPNNTVITTPYSPEQIKKAQEWVGLTGNQVDGIWGNISSETAKKNKGLYSLDAVIEAMEKEKPKSQGKNLKSINFYSDAYSQFKTVDGIKYGRMEDGSWAKMSDIMNSELQAGISGSSQGASIRFNPNTIELYKFDTGGYTGEWDSSGRLAMLHQKEIVLNAHDTENFLAAINIVRDVASLIDLRAAAQQSALAMLATAATANNTTQTLQQEVTIHAEFPNATQRTEIEAAFDTLLNRASQFANRKN